MNYRKEIDGLRALAVLPVIFFHAGFAPFSGGYVGVDIFFVITGYLITAILTQELAEDSFSLVRFYERRARRILPALFFVMACVIPFAWIWMPPHDLREFSKSLTAVPLFASNILFYASSGYFDSASEYKPLLHTWSLAVEEQFYLLFPLFLLAAWRLGKKWVITLLSSCALLSLFAAMSDSKIDAPYAFYLLPTRAFEILIGALLSFCTPSLSKDVKGRQLLSSAGLALILYALCAFDRDTPSPSLYTLAPTLGAGLILLYANDKTFAGTLLGNKVLVGIGLVSYSAYLWHQPLLALARLRALGEVPQSILAILSLTSLVLGYISWRFIETPFRDRTKTSRRKIVAVTLTGALLFISLGLVGYLRDGFPGRLRIPAEVAESFADTTLRERCDTAVNKRTGDNIDFCSLGDTERPTITLAIFGDSQSEAILPVLDKIGKEREQRYSHLALGGCPSLLGVDVMRGNWKRKVCENLAQRQYDFVKENGIKNVLLVGRWSLYTDGNYDNAGMYYLVTDSNLTTDRNTSRLHFEMALKETIKRYQELGVNVFVLSQIPQQKYDAEALYTKLYWFDVKDKEGVIKSLSVSKDEHVALQAFNRGVIQKLQRELKFTNIELDQEFCRDSKCYLGDGTTSKYRDDDHLSTNGALSLFDALRALLETLS